MTPRLCTKCVFSPGLIQCGESVVVVVVVGETGRETRGEVCAGGSGGVGFVNAGPTVC